MRSWAVDMLTRAGIEAPHLNADELLAHCLDVTRGEVWPGAPQMTEASCDRFRSLVGRRLNREPLQYILGHWGFWSLDLKVTRDVMVPRPETEILVQEAVRILRSCRKQPIKILDIGTGSGNIAIALASEFPFSKVTATDISLPALSVAEDNARRCGIKDRIEFLHGDLFEPVAGRSFNLILSNPPYIPSSAIGGLEPEVRDFEPRAALDGGEDGTEILRRIIFSAGGHLTPGGWLILEAGDDQAERVAHTATEGGMFRGARIINDLHGIPRVVTAYTG